MDLIYFVKILLKRKFLIISVTLTSIIISFFLLKHTPNMYKSRAKVATGITDEFKLSIDDDESRKPHVIANKFSNLIQLMKSRSVIELLSYKLMLNDNNSEGVFRENGELYRSLDDSSRTLIMGIFKEKYSGLTMLTSLNDNERLMGKLLEEKKYDYKSLLEKLKVYRLEISDFIEIEFESENPFLSSFVVNNLIAEFKKYYEYISREKSSNSVNFFSNLANQKKRELDSKVEQMKVFKLNNGIINLYEQTEAIVDQIAKVEIMREKDKKQINSIISAITVIDSQLVGSDRSYLESSRKPFNKEISNLKNKINGLNERRVKGFITEQEAEDSLLILKSDLNRLVSSLSDEMVFDPDVSIQTLVLKKLNYTLELEIAEKSVESINKELDRLYQVASGFAPSEAFISSFEREISVAEEVYILMLNKLNSATLNSLNLAGSINQIETAIPAEKPEASKKLLLMLLSGIVSMIFTVVIIFVLEYLDLTIKSPMRFKLLSSLPLLGIINRLNIKQLDLIRIFSEEEIFLEEKIFRQLNRTIRYEVVKRLEGENSVLITSTNKLTGKTLITASLAYSLSLMKKKVLIIDANFEKNDLSMQFGAKGLLHNLYKFSNDYSEIITKTNSSYIDIVGSKTSVQNFSEICEKEFFEKFYAKMCKEYDYIIIEGPALNFSPDSRELAKYADLILPVFGSSSIISNADKNSIEFLKSLNSKLGGAILNRVSDEYLETVIGELPHNRNKVRIGVKKLLSRNFSKSNKYNNTVITSK